MSLCTTFDDAGERRPSLGVKEEPPGRPQLPPDADHNDDQVQRAHRARVEAWETEHGINHMRLAYNEWLRKNWASVADRLVEVQTLSPALRGHPDVEWSGAYPTAVEDTNSTDGAVEVAHFSFDYDLFNRENPS